MLLEANYKGRAKSRYICDRCKVELLGTDDRYRISAWAMPEEKRLNRWDFCCHCYIALCKGIEKGKKRV